MTDNEARGEAADGAVGALGRELTALRLHLEDEVRTRRVVIVDEAGHPRLRLQSTDERGRCGLVMLDPDGAERVRLVADTEIGILSILTADSAPSEGRRTRVDVFALEPDPEDVDGSYIGVELVDHGNSVAGWSLYEGRPVRSWSAEDL